MSRKEIYEQRITALSSRETYVGSELSILGEKFPVWKEYLRPMYLDYIPNKGYLLVTTIPNSAVCYQRGRPTSLYVVFAPDQHGWHEVPIYEFLDGRRANLLLVASRTNANGQMVSIERKEKINQALVMDQSQKSIQLKSRFGC